MLTEQERVELERVEARLRQLVDGFNPKMDGYVIVTCELIGLANSLRLLREPIASPASPDPQNLIRETAKDVPTLGVAKTLAPGQSFVDPSSRLGRSRTHTKE